MIVERSALEHRVVESLAAGRIPVVLGGCGTGRTSLLLRLVQLAGAEHAQYLDFAAAATTPERCLASVLDACPFRPGERELPSVDSPRGAFDALTQWLDTAVAADGARATFLLDEFLDVRTFESFPGLRHVQREFVARLADSPSRFVLASRFTSRTHRLLRDAPARFEVIHVPPLEVHEVQALAARVDGAHPEWAAAVAPAVQALAAGRAAYVHLLLDALAAMGPSTDAVAALLSLLAPDGRLTDRCRAGYELRLHRARGYGALKAILGDPRRGRAAEPDRDRPPAAADARLDEGLPVVARGCGPHHDAAQALLVRGPAAAPLPSAATAARCRRPTAMSVREIQTYAQARLPRAPDAAIRPGPAARPEPTRAAAEPALVTADRPSTPDRGPQDVTRDSGIIEID